MEPIKTRHSVQDIINAYTDAEEISSGANDTWHEQYDPALDMFELGRIYEFASHYLDNDDLEEIVEVPHHIAGIMQLLKY